MENTTTTSTEVQAPTDFFGSDAPESVEPSSVPETFEVKVDGKVLKVSKDELIKNFQLEQASRARMQKAAKAQQESERQMQQIAEIFQILKSSPRDVFSELGVDFDALAEEHLLEKIRREQMTPEQRELDDLRKQREEWESEKKRRAEEQKRVAYERQVASAMEQIDADLLEALAKTGIKANHRMVALTGEIMLSAMQNGQSMTWEEALSRAQTYRKSELSDYLGTIDPEALEQLLGSENVERIRKASLSKVKNPFAKKSEDTFPSVKQTQRKIPEKDFWNKFNQKYNLR